MPQTRYRYHVVRSKEDPSLAVWVPVIPVSLIYQGKRRTVGALIDSGADLCLFHASIGRSLGIDVENGRLELFKSLGPDTIPCYVHTVSLGLKGESNVDIEVGFMMSDFLADGGLLGQKGFFDHFQVRFRRWENAIYIDRRRGQGKGAKILGAI